MDQTRLKFTYEQGTDTIRTVPERFCVTGFRRFVDGGSFDPVLEARKSEIIAHFVLSSAMFQLLKEIIERDSLRGIHQRGLEKRVTELLAKIEGAKHD